MGQYSFGIIAGFDEMVFTYHEEDQEEQPMKAHTPAGVDRLFFLVDSQAIADMGVELAQGWADLLIDTRWLDHDSTELSLQHSKLYNG